MKTFAAAILASGLLIVAGGATANPFVQDAARVQLADLDLATPAGQNSLTVRLERAATAVCGDSSVASIHLDMAEKARACRAEVIADARSRIDAMARTGGSAGMH